MSSDGERDRTSSASGQRTSIVALLSKLLAVLALAGTVYGVATSPSSHFKPIDDTRPPVPRPHVAAAIPSDTKIARLIGTPLLRVQDGLPDSRLFNSTLPIARDIRQQALAGAWQTIWNSPNARTDVFVELVARRESSTPPHFVTDCTPNSPVSWPAPVVRAGFTVHRATSAAFCALGLEQRTEIFVGVATSDTAVIPHVRDRVKALFNSVVAGTPTARGPEVTHYATPNARSQIEKGLLGAVIGLALLWVLPTLLFDRGTWQRLTWAMSRLWPSRRRRQPPGIDIDRPVRQRLWVSAVVGLAQVCAAVWMLRLSDSFRWGTITTALSVVAAVLAVAGVQRAMYLRGIPRSQVFARRRRVMAVIGLGAGLVIVAASLAVLFAAISFSALGQGNSNPDYIQERMDIAIEVLAIPLVLLASLPLMMLRRVAMRALRTESLRDSRPPVLLLRSFADDKRRLRSRSGYRRSIVDRLSLRLWERFEEILAVSLNQRGPVLAVSQVGERLPPQLGAVRRQFSSDEWQAQVSALMAESSIICVTVGRSAALRWEIERIAAQRHLHKTIFVLPPTSRAEHTKRLAVLGSLLHLPWTALEVAGSNTWVLAAVVPEFGRAAIVVRASAQEDVAYDLALDICTREIAETVAAPLAPVPNGEAKEEHWSGPAAEIYATGKTPTYKPLLRRRWVIVALALSGSSIVTAASTFLLGANPDKTDSLLLAPGYSASAIGVDATRGTVYAVINYDLLGTIDFARRSEQGLTHVSGADDLVANDGEVYLASDVKGTVEAYNADRHVVTWTLHALPGVRGLVLRGDRLIFVVPATGEVRTVDATTGKTQATTHVAGVPWADTIAGGKLYVSIFNRSRVLVLNPRTLNRVSTGRTSRGPDQLAATERTVWVYSAYAHTIVPLRGPGESRRVIYTSNPAPIVTSNGTTLAIEGIEQISTLGPDGILRRSPLVTRTASALVMTPTGNLIAAGANQLLLIHR